MPPGTERRVAVTRQTLGPMDDLNDREQSTELLQQLGLKEYEAKCFVALTRLPRGTAKEISEISDVPRTRVYDAIRVLETKGLVEVQHSSPQQFRAVSVDEATETLRAEFSARADSLRESLDRVEPAAVEDHETTHEVWALAGTEAVAARTVSMVEAADREVFLVLGRTAEPDEALLGALRGAADRGVDVVVGTVEAPLRDRVLEAVPDAEAFVSGLEWLSGGENDDVDIGRLVLVDRDTILMSSRHGEAGSGERAVFGTGFTNGLVVIVRRLMATGLLRVDDPAD